MLEQMLLKNTLRTKLKARVDKRIEDLNEALYNAHNRITRAIIRTRGRINVIETTQYSLVYQLSEKDIFNLKQTVYRYDRLCNKLQYRNNSKILLFISHCPNTEPAETMTIQLVWIKENEEQIIIMEESMLNQDGLNNNYRSRILVDKLWVISEQIIK